MKVTLSQGQYLDVLGAHCPWCQSDDLRGGDLQGEYYRYIGWESAIGDTLIRGERSSEAILQAIRDLDPAYDNDWRSGI